MDELQQLMVAVGVSVDAMVAFQALQVGPHRRSIPDQVTVTCQ
jgi:hypothetical protein